MNKYKDERYINQRKLKDGWSFQVIIRDKRLDKPIIETFSEKKYGSAKLAYDVAVTYRNKKLAELADDLYTNGGNKTLRQLFDEMVEHSSWSRATLKKFNSRFNLYIKNDSLLVKDLTPGIIEKSLNDTSRTATKNTIAGVFTLWKHLVHYANINNYLVRDITLLVKVPKSKVIKAHRNEDLSYEDFLKVIDAVSKHQMYSFDRKQYPLILWTIYYTGLRPAECLALKKDDIKDGFINIRQGLDSYGNVSAVKTQNAIREIPIVDELKPYLYEAMELSKSEYLFPTRDGGLHTSTVLGDVIHGTAKKHANVDFHLYMLRHKFSTDLLMSGVDPRTHKELMGHQNYTMSVEYARSSKEKRTEALKSRSKSVAKDKKSR